MPLVDTGEAYAALQDAAALGVSYLTAYSFELLQERAIILGRPRSMIDLSGELLGAVDSALDDMININRMTGDDMIEMPVGRRIVYYV